MATVSVTSTTPTQHNLDSSRFNQRNIVEAQQTSSKAPANTDYQAQYRQQPAYHLSLNQQQVASSFTYQHLHHHHHTSSGAVEHTEAIATTTAVLPSTQTILHFIEQGIIAAKADGASAQTLAELLQQGFSGFTQGYQQALAQLGEPSALTATVNNAVSTLHDQVVAGINHLSQSYIGDGDGDGRAHPQPVADIGISPKLATNTTAINPQQNWPAKHRENHVLSAIFTEFATEQEQYLHSLLASLNNAEDDTITYASKEHFFFELTTTDGDTIAIQASHSATAAEQHKQAGKMDESNFTFTVDGELDEAETIALKDLLSQVMSLADNFYSGDIASTYQAGLALGHNKDEIIAYTINLKQIATYQAAATYQQLDPPTSHRATPAQDPLARIGNYAHSVLTSLNNTANYQRFDYTQLLKNLAEQIDAQINSTYPQGFHDTIADILT